MRPQTALVLLSLTTCVACGAAAASSSAAPPPAPSPEADTAAPVPPEEPADTCHLRYDRRWEPYQRIQNTAWDLSDFLSLNRRELARTCSEFEDVRVRMIQKIAEYRDAPAVPLLVEQLADPLSMVRREAARALGAIGPPDALPAVPALRRLVEDPEVGDAERAILRETLQALEGGPPDSEPASG